MAHALALYRRLLAVEIRAQLQYRAGFILDMTGTFFQVGLWFVALAGVFARFERLGGWTFGEIAFLYGLVETAFGTMDMVFSGFDPGYFGQHVRRGTFDQFLLRPAGLTLQVLGSRFLLRRLARVAEGLLIFSIALAALDVHWTAAKLAYLPLVVAGLVAFFGGLFIVGSAITFWTVEPIEFINIFTYGGAEMMSYPMHIFPLELRRFFTYVVPAIFLNYYPALFFLDKPDPLGLPAWAPFVSPLAGVAVLAAALGAWRVGLRHYQSTGT
jgi:ABC-2 type transport system permease protein